MTMKITTCEDCKATAQYKTKKPKLCAACRKKKPKFYRKPKVPPQRSKKEAKMQYILNSILPEAEYIDNGYYSWLLSPKNAPMQIDRLYPRLKLGFEFNGRQHYEYNPYMHQTKEAFEYLQECDRRKNKLLKKLGYKLITIKYDKKITKGYLIRRLEEEGVMNEVKSKTLVNDKYEY